MKTRADVAKRSCENKVAYETKADAQKAAQRMEQLEKDKFIAYPCPFAAHWHVAHDK